MAYIPPHTQVKTHLASTMQMQRDIKNEVNRVTKGLNTNNVNPVFNIESQFIVNGNLDNTTASKLKEELNTRDKKLKDDIIKSFKKEFDKY